MPDYTELEMIGEAGPRHVVAVDPIVRRFGPWIFKFRRLEDGGWWVAMGRRPRRPMCWPRIGRLGWYSFGDPRFLHSVDTEDGATWVRLFWRLMWRA